MHGLAIGRRGGRFTEAAKLLPVLFIVCNIAGLYAIYTFLHLLRLLQAQDPATRQRGLTQLAVFNVGVVLMLVSYARCILVHPGTVPDRMDDPSWEYTGADSHQGAAAPVLAEAKKSGERRHCKWCAKYKPDRTHHCRVCGTCVLRMDHHCPWIYNCVGYRNHKYFLLLLVYAAFCTQWIGWTMLESAESALGDGTDFASTFLVLFGEVLAAFMGFVVTGFLGFHAWLAARATTTIEFCEKSAGGGKGRGTSPYDRGLLGNARAVLGENPLLWLLPLSPPTEGGGVYFTAGAQATGALLGRSAHSKKSRGQEASSGRSGGYGAAGPWAPAPNDPFRSSASERSSAQERAPLFTGYAAPLRSEHV